MSGPAEHVERQRRFYDERDHAHLQARHGDLYAAKLAAELARVARIGPSSRVLEVGAGFGRFTFDLLGHCERIVALDVSSVALERLEAERAERGIAADRIETRRGDLDRMTTGSIGAPFDAIVGFFLLHHLPDFAASIARLASWLAPDARVGFLEPNRRNPLFFAQVMCCPDMAWREEKGMFRLSARGVERAYRRAGLVDLRTESHGFFPPRIYNSFAIARRFEAGLERIGALRPFLPFFLITARAPQVAAGPSHERVS